MITSDAALAERWLERFLEALASEKGVAQNTLIAYQRDIQDWIAFLKERSVCSADAKDAERYVATLLARELKSTSICRHVSALRQFYLFLLSEKYVTEQPFLNFALQAHKPLPRVLNVSEMRDLLMAAQRDATPEGRRLWALAELLYATGLRVSELVTLPLTTIAHLLTSPDPSAFLVAGKGGHERMVFLTAQAVEALRAYLTIRPLFTKPANNAYLFASSGKERHLTRQRVGQLLKDLAIRANIHPERVSPHVLRHAFATHLLSQGVDLISLQALLGHRDISTTQIYTHVDQRRLTEVMTKYHPLSCAS